MRKLPLALALYIMCVASPAFGQSILYKPLVITGINATPQAVKSTGGQIGRLQCDNTPNAAITYVELYNAAPGAVNLANKPDDYIVIPANWTNGFVLSEQFSNPSGFSIVAVTALQGNTGPGTAISCAVPYQ